MVEPGGAGSAFEIGAYCRGASPDGREVGGTGLGASGAATFVKLVARCAYANSAAARRVDGLRRWPRLPEIEDTSGRRAVAGALLIFDCQRTFPDCRRWVGARSGLRREGPLPDGHGSVAERLGEVRGGGPGGEAGGDGEVVVGCVAFERPGRQQQLEVRDNCPAGNAGIAAGERVGSFASGVDD